jgi:ATP-dependent Lon protease
LLLNIKGNPDNPFRAQLKDIRKKAVQRTRELDIVPRVSAPEPIEAPAEQHFTIEDGATGHTYDTIFGRYLVGAKAITIEDPYIRTQHQVTNFVRFCETVVRAGPTVRRINLITGYDDKTDRTMVRNKLEELKESLRERAVLLDIQWSETKHDREVQIDNGWTVKIGRGLDFYQRPNGWSSIGATDLGLRKCRETKVDIFRRR